MANIVDTARMALWNIGHRLGPMEIVDILVTAVIIYEILLLMHQTRGSAVLKGLVLLLLATAVSTLFGLTALNWMLMSVIKNGALVLVVLFQPELRKALEQLGRGAVLDNHRGESNESPEHIIDEIILCLNNLSHRKVGALIVFEQKTGLQDIIETGTTIDGRISAPLLENIFEPKTPLHDGAVIIRGERVIAGACILTLTENTKVDRALGTRHRAAIGVSETTDAVVLIVSEETGIISMARGGMIERNLDNKRMRAILEPMFSAPRGGLLSRVRRKEAQ